MSDDKKCPIWGTPATIEPKTGDYEIVDSPRAGGRYSVSVSALAETRWGTMNNATKARLTTWLIDQRELDPTQPPKITSYTIDEIERSQPLPVHERADRLLKYLEKNLKPSAATFVLYTMITTKLIRKCWPGPSPRLQFN